MREIKFRAWDGKRMIESWGIKKLSWSKIGLLLNSSIKIVKGNTINEWDKGEIELMQFTGLLDKNGIEIYEGDIVKVGEIYFTIGWYQQSAAFWLISTTPSSSITNISSVGVPARDWNWLDSGKSVYWHGIKKSQDCEIIGNIWENINLLSQ